MKFNTGVKQVKISHAEDAFGAARQLGQARDDWLGPVDRECEGCGMALVVPVHG